MIIRKRPRTARSIRVASAWIRSERQRDAVGQACADRFDSFYESRDGARASTYRVFTNLGRSIASAFARPAFEERDRNVGRSAPSFEDAKSGARFATHRQAHGRHSASHHENIAPATRRSDVEESRRVAMGGMTSQNAEKAMSCPSDGCEHPANVGTIERAASVAIGVAATLAGINRGGTTGLLLAGVGAAAIYRGISGHCYGYEALGIDTSDDADDPVGVLPEQRTIERGPQGQGSSTSASIMPGTS